MAIKQELRHNIYGKSTKDYLPVVTCKANETVEGRIQTDLRGITGLVGHVYTVLAPTGLNDPYIQVGGDHATGAVLGYTGYNDTISYTFDPTILGAQHGQNYGIEFTCFDAEDITIEKLNPDIIVEIRDSVLDFGITGVAGQPNIYQGIQGDTGAVGPVGPIGETGLPGGPEGFQGITGSNGIQGITGAIGTQGLTGVQGITGSQGATGFKGVTGAIGATGSQGVGGDVGATGAQGITGLAGINGATGLAGAQGLTGAVGLQGVTGLRGVTGLSGTAGTQGATGLSGSNGTQGSTGAQGTVGIQGVTGVRGFTGFAGTNGSQGTTGLSGTQGVTGFRGFTGVQGFTGSGTAGSNGATGLQGATGSNGTQGIQGVTGVAGLGATGLQGVTGAGNFEPLHQCSRAVLLESDFYTVSVTAACKGLLGAAQSSGTAAAIAGDANHPGVISMSDSTTANGGYRFMTDTSAFRIAGGERFNIIFKIFGVRAGQQLRMGFMDSTASQTQPTDGVWFQTVSNGSTTTILGRCKNNAGPSDTSGAYTLTAASWYEAECIINSNATSVTFNLYDSSNALVWTRDVTGNIPTAAGRETGFGIICGESTTDAAAVICHIDYVRLEIVRTLTRCS